MGVSILNHHQILGCLRRMANEIAEQHCFAQTLYLVGLNQRGEDICGRLATELALVLPNLQIIRNTVVVSDGTAKWEHTPDCKDYPVLVVDDVINSGKTLMLVISKLFEVGAGSIQTAFLAKREHRNYPVKADFVGISIATTLQEHVFYDNQYENDLKVYLT